jgi:hypothetical protein
MKHTHMLVAKASCEASWVCILLVSFPFYPYLRPVFFPSFLCPPFAPLFTYRQSCAMSSLALTLGHFFHSFSRRTVHSSLSSLCFLFPSGSRCYCS